MPVWRCNSPLGECTEGGGSTGRAVAVYILEYPGYSGRAGKPSEPAIVTAALAAIDALPQDGTPVYLLGESLGCAVAMQGGGRPAIILVAWCS